MYMILIAKDIRHYRPASYQTNLEIRALNDDILNKSIFRMRTKRDVIAMKYWTIFAGLVFQVLLLINENDLGADNRPLLLQETSQYIL